jgi:hypothetical protein
MSFVTANFMTNEPTGSQARGAAVLGNATLAFGLSKALTAAGVATATTTSKVKTVNTLTYTVAGKFYTKAATDNFWTLAGATVPAAGFQKYLLLIDTAGAASTVEATASTVSQAAVSWSNVSANSAWAPFLTAIGSTKAIVGMLYIATDATHTFVPGTTLLGATGITATFQDGPDQSILPLMGNETGTLVGNGA